MHPIPHTLVETLQPFETQAVHHWWSKLTEDAQSEIATLCDTRQDFFSFTTDQDETGQQQWPTLPILVQGQFVEKEEEAKNDDWSVDLYEYLVSHPEVFLLSQFQVRTFHICTSNETARSALEAGVIPADFKCPFHSQDCPMQSLLQRGSGKSCVLSGSPINIFQRLTTNKPPNQKQP